MINLIGFLLPPLIDLINRKVADSDARFWISVLVCSLVGIILEIATHGLVFTGVEPYVQEILYIFGLAQLSYKAIYEDSKMQIAIRGTDSSKVEIQLPKIK